MSDLTGWKARDAAYREQQRSRARHNRRMKADPAYRDAFVARRIKDGEARHADHIRPVREAKYRRIATALMLTAGVAS